jgi:hypothetical protein
MDKFHIAMYAGKYLEHNFTISPTSLNHFIAKQEEVGKLIDDKDVRETLEDMVTAGWVEIEKSDKINPIYVRYVTEYEKKKIKGNGKR